MHGNGIALLGGGASAGGEFLNLQFWICHAPLWSVAPLRVNSENGLPKECIWIRHKEFFKRFKVATALQEFGSVEAMRFTLKDKMRERTLMQVVEVERTAHAGSATVRDDGAKGNDAAVGEVFCEVRAGGHSIKKSFLAFNFLLGGSSGNGFGNGFFANSLIAIEGAIGAALGPGGRVGVLTVVLVFLLQARDLGF